MTSHLDGHITTDLKPEMLSVIKTGNRMPHDQKEIECHMIQKCMWHCTCKNMHKRRHFQAKTTNLNTYKHMEGRVGGLVKFGCAISGFICFDFVSFGLVILVDGIAFLMAASQVTSNQKCYSVSKLKIEFHMNKKCMWHFSWNSNERE